MRIVRNPIFTSKKNLPVSIIIISVFMFLISVFDISLVFNKGACALRIGSLGIWSTLLSIVPLSWALCTVLLLKFKKANFAKIPAYITCALNGIGYILYLFIAGKNNIINILLFSVAVLLIYPFIIATLTLEGRIYNRVFSILFSSVLLAITLIGAIIYFFLKGAIVLTFLLPALMYIELILIVLCFRLEKPVKKTETTNTITH